MKATVRANWQRPKRALKTCDVSGATLARWIKNGTIATKKIGGIRYVDVSDWVQPEEASA